MPNISKNLILVFVSTLAILFFYQNCGEGFETQLSSNADGRFGENQDLLSPVDVNDSSPLITAPAAALSLGMNVPSKIIVSIEDPDSDSTLVNYVIRSAPREGTLTLDPGSVAEASRGVTYSPRANFIGADSFVLNVIDPEGNMGPDQRFDISVDAKGIGQMIGTFAKSACTPVTSPVTGTYTSTQTSYLLRQTVYSQDCSIPVYENTMEGNHAIGSENIMTSNGVSGFEYNVMNSRITIRPLSAVAAQALNAQSYCGRNNWAANVLQDITATGCGGVWAGSNIYMIRRVEFPQGQPPRLFYSSSVAPGNGNTPQTRSLGLELGTAFIRQ